MAGKVNDVQPIFVYDEPVTFDEHGIKYTIIDPREYGVHFKGQAYFTTSNTVQNNPVLVKNFLSAIIDGWSKVSSDQESGIAALKKIAPTTDEKREREMLRRGLKFFVSPQGKILMTDLETWKDMFRTLRETKTVENEINVEQLFALDPLRQVYASRKK
jgi:ABC-type nitrate/sulfonate/bicarbonate transport system substrate-binding protein